MREVHFSWNVKEKPEDFIVSEVSNFDLVERGNFYLYRLVKRGFNTQEVARRFNLSYAGLKDKNAITFQYVSSPRFLGEAVFEKKNDNFFGLIFIGKIRKKVRIGNLKGNLFSVLLKGHTISEKRWFINYYDLQRISRNTEKGKKVLQQLKEGISWKMLSWKENFYLDAYLSHLWNKAVMVLLKESYTGYYVVEKGKKFFIPETDYQDLMENFPRFFPILGYKVKLSDKEADIYRYVLEKEEFTFEDMLCRLKQLKIKGDYRKTFLKAENIQIKNGRINFFLPKGAYATMFLKNVFIQ